jgi:putative selenium metabolism hydrolase
MDPLTKKRLVDLTSQLVRTPSVSPDEKKVAELVARAMEERGFDAVEIDPCGNAVGIVEGALPGPTVLLDAHMDTIGVAPRNAWSRDPLSGEVDGDLLHGRGSSDMKGALAAMIVAVSGIDRARLSGRAVVSASVGEEVIEGEALRHVMARHGPDAVIIGESTGLDLVRGGRGRAELVVETRGRPAHASTPERGVNAIHRMLPVIEELERIPCGEHPVVGRGVMALTAIVSDPYPPQSVVPSRCRVTIERRLMPGETEESVVNLLREACRSAGEPDARIALARAAYTTWTGMRFERPKWFPAWVLEEDHPLLLVARSALEALGQSPALAAYGFCTNAAYSAGVAGIPTLGYGPSTEADAHVIDERVSITELVKACEGYAAIVEAVLGGQGCSR